ncbi:unnamed protein product [Knipowitschia caucasica]|uniref:L1 transposable element RRM domain-containing protein n=1 Tax=Knipowitschia caucasica TaxID=637954 RepID=A0AAV2K1K4_KNICA
MEGNIEDDEMANSNSPVSHEDENSDPEEDKLSLILREIRELREDNKEQLGEIKRDIGKINSRVDDTERRLVTAEARVQGAEDVLAEVVKQHEQLKLKVCDLEGRSRRDNVRIYGIPEGEEGSPTPDVTLFVERLLRENLGFPADKELLMERAHRALAPRPPAGSQPRSIIVKFRSYRAKDEVLRAAWQRKGFTWKGSKINLDHDYAPDVLAKRKEYAEIRRILKANNIRFQTLFPARLKVFLKDETKIYDSVEDASSALADLGLPVTRVTPPESLLAKLQRYTWTPAPRRKTGYKEKLQEFRRDTTGNTST